MPSQPKGAGPLSFGVDVNPVDVSVNIHYRRACTKVPQRVRVLQDKIRDAAEAEAKRSGWKVPVGPVGVELHFTFQGHTGDGDNPIKRTLDAVQEGLKFNDSKIVEGHWYRHIGIPGIQVKVYETVHPDGITDHKGHQTFTFPPSKDPRISGRVIGA